MTHGSSDMLTQFELAQLQVQVKPFFTFSKKIPIHTYVISQPKTMTIGKKFLDGKI